MRAREFTKKCPPATQDIGLNLKNRQKAINEYGYGPLNPLEPNVKFWAKKQEMWQLDSIEDAKKSLCGNCAAFDVSKDSIACIEKGIGNDSGSEDPHDVVEAGDLGYCRFLKFKCASLRTCDAWVVGGPITENFAEDVAEGGAETSWSDDTDTITLQDILELTKHIKQINLPINDNLKSKLIHWDGNPEEIERINQVTVSTQFPILIIVDEQGQIKSILDGNHRLHKAIQSQAKTIPAKLIKPSDLSDKARKVFHIEEQDVTENFADGKGPGRPGDSQRHGIPKGATMAQLEKAAKAPGRKGQLARWQINMRRGRKK